MLLFLDYKAGIFFHNLADIQANFFIQKIVILPQNNFIMNIIKSFFEIFDVNKKLKFFINNLIFEYA